MSPPNGAGPRIEPGGPTGQAEAGVLTAKLRYTPQQSNKQTHILCKSKQNIIAKAKLFE